MNTAGIEAIILRNKFGISGEPCHKTEYPAIIGSWIGGLLES